MAQGTESLRIASVKGHQILDSRNNPTVACRMTLSDNKHVVFMVPSGASTGEKEAVELRDGGDRFRGKGVSQAAINITARIAPKVEGLLLGISQEKFDLKLRRLDGTKNKRKLGANAILAVSGAFALAKAHSEGREPWARFGFSKGLKQLDMPVPMFNVLNAGRHADTGFEVQETMIIPVGARTFFQAVEMGTDVWHALKGILKKGGYSTGRGDEGGFVNPFKSIEKTIDAVLKAIDKCKYAAGKQIALAFDGAFSEIFGKDLYADAPERGDKTYHFGGKRLSSQEVVGLWAGLAEDYPIISLEDAMGERDRSGWKLLTGRLGSRVQLVLDDYICTNPEIIRKAVRDGVGNAHLIKLNQIGTVSETIKAMALGFKAGRPNIISHRSGETEDAFIAHLAMHPHVSQIKSGSSGSDRNAKYNALLMIEQELAGGMAAYRGMEAFPESVSAAWVQRWGSSWDV